MSADGQGSGDSPPLQSSAPSATPPAAPPQATPSSVAAPQSDNAPPVAETQPLVPGPTPAPATGDQGAEETRKPKSLLKPVGDFLTSATGQILTGAVGAVAAAVISWLTPLGDVIRDWLWQENIEISEELPAAEKELRDLRFVLLTKTRAGFSGGTITVSSADQSIEFVGDSRFIAGKSDGSVKVPDANALKIRPLTAGTHVVHVELTTNRGRDFKGDVKVIVAPRVQRQFLGQEENWTGTWRMALNGEDGTVTLTDNVNRNLSGTAKFDNGVSFQVDPTSWHDGTSFLLLLNGEHERMRIKGLPCEVSNTFDKWRVLNGKVEVWDGATRIERSRPLGTIMERCDKMRERLSDTPGDGVFEARIMLP